VLIINRPVWKSPVEVDVDQDRWEFAPTLVHWGKLFVYVFWLLIEIAKANIQVAYLVLHPRKPIRPLLLGFRVGLRSPISRVTLGNSITLTPGTLTLEIKEDWFLVHALGESSATSLLTGAMQQRVAGVYRYEQGLVGEGKIYHRVEDLG
jgi:multisubunit Na+/H+ antiporter MnhE subunit